MLATVHLIILMVTVFDIRAFLKIVFFHNLIEMESLLKSVNIYNSKYYNSTNV